MCARQRASFSKREKDVITHDAVEGPLDDAALCATLGITLKQLESVRRDERAERAVERLRTDIENQTDKSVLIGTAVFRSIEYELARLTANDTTPKERTEAARAIRDLAGKEYADVVLGTNVDLSDLSDAGLVERIMDGADDVLLRALADVDVVRERLARRPDVRLDYFNQGRADAVSEREAEALPLGETPRDSEAVDEEVRVEAGQGLDGAGTQAPAPKKTHKTDEERVTMARRMVFSGEYDERQAYAIAYKVKKSMVTQDMLNAVFPKDWFKEMST